MKLCSRSAIERPSAAAVGSYLNFLGDEVIQPAGVDVIVSEAFRLQQLDEILNCGPEVASDGQLLHGHHHVSESRGKNAESVYCDGDSSRKLCFTLILCCCMIS